MRTLYIDCAMGAAGDMLTAALLELLPNPDEFMAEINGLGIPNVQIKKETAVKCGVTGTHITVTVGGMEEDEQIHTHHHSGMHDVGQIVSQLALSEAVKAHVLAVYQLIAEAESHVHGVPVSQIHFHEVGAMDAIADIVSVCLLMERLGPEQVIVSPVHVGSGQVSCAHGILPVPAPATAYLLQGAPIYGGAIKGELCTPTGAALLKHFATAFGGLPVMKTEAIGYGMGKKDFPAANCVRVLLGDTEETGETITELSCNLDDMTPEAIGFAMDRLLEAGALDVYTTPVGMKKNRPGTLLCVLCQNERRDEMVKLLFQHTTTLGIRETVCKRYVLTRRTDTIQTSFGAVRKKVSSGYGIKREKYEYDDISRIAREQNLSLADVVKQMEE